MIRIRPPLRGHTDGGFIRAVSEHEVDYTNKGKTHQLNCEYAFGKNRTQAEVYNEVKDLIVVSG